MSLKLVCIGDVHLGRSPSRVPGACIEAVKRGGRQALRNAVDLARRTAADAVVFTGDIVDKENAYFEGLTALRQAIADLGSAGIPTVAVSGNHDFDTLKALSAELPQLKLLGIDGTWEEWVLETGSARRVCFRGRSFNQQWCQDNPLLGYPPVRSDLPTVAVLHCDVDVPGSKYGPVALRELLAAGADAWLLGHVHKPTLLSTSPLVLYPGSLQGMDPGEPGPHGAWIVEWTSGGRVRTTQHVLAPLRYDALTVTLDDIEQTAELRPLVSRHVQQFHQRLLEERGETKAVGLRLLFEGRPLEREALSSACLELPGDAPWELDGIAYFIEKSQWNCQPRLPLDSLAEMSDPAGLLARRLLVLERRNPEQEYLRLVDAARQRMERDVIHTSAFAPLDGQRLDDDAVRSKLIEAAREVLDQLLAQKQVPV